MIAEYYVSFETALLLKKKGFDMSCEYLGYNIFDSNHRQDTIENFSRTEAPHLCVPTISQARAMKWLREIYKLEVRSTYDYDKDSWWGNINPMFDETDENTDTYQKALRFDYQGKSYEEAAEVAIKYCIENLI